MSRIPVRPAARGLRALSLVVIGALVAGAPGRARAQGVRPVVGVSAVTATTDHELVRGLWGVAVRADTPLGDSRVSLRVGLEHLRGERGRLGSTCVGFVAPGVDCTPIPLRDEARLTSGEAGLGVRLLRGARLSADLVGAVRLAEADVTTRAPANAYTSSFRAEQAMLGYELGAELAWAPARRVPLALVGGATLGAHGAFRREEIADGYTPFQSGFTTRRAFLGVALVAPAR